MGFNQTAQAAAHPKPRITWDTAHDVSPPLRVLAANRVAPDAEDPADELDLGPMAGADSGYSADGALQSALLPATIPSTQQNFEGLSNQDNFNIFGGRVNPPDPVGEVGPNNYVEMVNLAFAVYDKAGNRLLGPVDTGTLWSGFAVPDCTDPSGDPVVLYDQITDRWILSQFTTSGLDDPSKPFWNCVAVSTTGDPTGELLPLRVRDGALPVLPRLPEVRQLDGLVRPHDARVRTDRRVRNRRLRPREEQDGERPAGPGRAVLPRRQ